MHLYYHLKSFHPIKHIFKVLSPKKFIHTLRTVHFAMTPTRFLTKEIFVSNLLLHVPLPPFFLSNSLNPIIPYLDIEAYVTSSNKTPFWFAIQTFGESSTQYVCVLAWKHYPNDSVSYLYFVINFRSIKLDATGFYFYSYRYPMSPNLGTNEAKSLINLCCSMVSKRPWDGVKEHGFLCLDDGPPPSICSLPYLDPNCYFHEKPRVYDTNCQISHFNCMKIKPNYHHWSKSNYPNNHITHIGL